jgi:U3-containing 90S pre-ribosomal complex subunit
MGGDDLGSDDEYVSGRLVRSAGSDASSSEDYDDERISSGKNELLSVSKGEKRKNRDGSSAAATGDADRANERSGGDEGTSSTKKRRMQGGPMQLLGGRIRQESVESKAEILSRFAGADFQPQHIARPQRGQADDQMHSNGIMDRLTCLVSKKQLKTKLRKGSPRAIVLCLSARRAVAVLKDLAPLGMRVAKLFPKQGTIDDQAKQLETTPFGLAVGTPHRINELIDRGSLSLGSTRLVGLDTFHNPKGYSVYTLADTAPSTEKLLKDYAHPECIRRKDLAVGFV